MAEPMSDEELYQLTGSWEAAAAMRDEQAKGATQNNTQTAAANVATPSGNITLEELKKMYAEKGATTQRITQSGDAGDVIDYLTNDLGQGFTAREDQPIIGYEGQGMDATPIYGDKVLSGFMQAKDGMDYFYDPEGVFQGSRKSQEADSFWDTFGPMIIGAMTMGGGTAALGGYLFPSLSATAAAGAGGALLGGANAAFTDQDILKGALLGGASSAGALQLGDTGFTLGDATKAINFAQNPTLAGAANLASPYVTTNFDIGDTGFTTNDLLKGVNTVQALGSGDNRRIFDTITGLARGTDFSGLTASEQAERDANRETARLNKIETDRLNRIESAVLNQPASDDGSTQGIVDLISEMYPAANVKGMSQGDLAKFLEANINEIQGSADLETLLKGAGQTTADEGTVTVTGDRPTGLGDFMVPTTDTSKGTVIPVDNPEELVITGDRPAPYVSSLRTKEIKSDIPDELTVDDIDKLFPDIDFNDILQTVVADGTKTVTPGGTKTVVPTKTTTPGTKTTEQSLTDLGLNAPMPSQDPYANIKLMEELFGGDTAYKLRALGAPKNLASADIDALARMLRG